MISIAQLILAQHYQTAILDGKRNAPMHAERGISCFAQGRDGLAGLAIEDAEFLAEVRKRNLNVEPLSGEEVQRIVAASAATPKELIDQAKRYIGTQ